MKDLVADTIRTFTRHGGTLLAGACAFFALLSAAPVLFIAISAAGAVTGEGAARHELLRGLGVWVGAEGAATLESLLVDGAARPAGLGSSLVSLAVLLYGSTRLFTHVQRALNHIWDVQARPGVGLRGKVVKQLYKRALAFSLVLLCAVFLAASVAARAVLSRAADVLGASLEDRWRVLDHGGTFVVVFLLFAALFKVLPDARVDARDAFAGALVSAVCFHFGKVLLGVYLAHKDLASTFGAAGSIVMVLLWVHYTAQVFFLGAAFAASCARRGGRAIQPSAAAMRVRVEDPVVR